MATVVNARDTLIQSETRTATIVLPGTIDWTQVGNSGGTRPTDNADVTANVISGGLTIASGGLVMNAGGSMRGGQSAYNTGNGWWIGYSSSQYRMSMKNASGYSFTFSSTGLDITGDIGGTSSIALTGSAAFDGSTSAGSSVYALSANNSGASVGGMYAKGGLIPIPAITGEAGTSGLTPRIGVQGSSNGGPGINGNTSSSAGYGAVSGTATHASSYGGSFGNSAGGSALSVGGPMVMSSSSQVNNLNAEFCGGIDSTGFARVDSSANVHTFFGIVAAGASTAGTANLAAKPGSNSDVSWLKLRILLTTYYLAAWT